MKPKEANQSKLKEVAGLFFRLGCIDFGGPSVHIAMMQDEVAKKRKWMTQGIPLLIIMIVAFISTQYPILIDKGFLAMAHEYITDFAMTLLLIYLLIYGGGNNSIDKRFTDSGVT